MVTFKLYTDISQSKKLAEILPLESADYFHAPDAGIVVTEPYKLNEGDETVITAYKGAIPCWSLAALLELLPEYNLQRTDWGNKTEYKIVVTVNDYNYASKNYDNPLDACYEMVLKLNELNLL